MTQRKPITPVNIQQHNSQAWNKAVDQQCQWTQPVSSEIIAAAKQGKWQVSLTHKPFPTHWLAEVKGLDILCLASGGGQQAPVLAAAGANVTVFDNSAKQLAQDQMVADRDGLSLKIIQGDMRDLSQFADASFDVVFHPISNLYVPNIRGVWQEAHRVLRSGGKLLSSFYNATVFIFDKDPELQEQGLLRPKYPLPYSCLSSLSDEERDAKIKAGEPLYFGHSLTDQIGGQTDVGFLIAGFYEDNFGAKRFLIEEFLPTYIATYAIKP
ncbi:MAG: class I SAM-dependent methyltransferase [Gammaproteobacteria bacterium]|nr:class I SAM-dependent methyltransferase [Gammaproteobacteria bacterium]